MAIYVTGDTHMPRDIEKINSQNWPEGTKLTKDDYLIQLGDFGLLWKNKSDDKEEYWTKWLDDQPWTTLFIDGNHENHYRLSKLETKEMFGGTVGKVSDSIYHLKRGQVYTINESTFFVMGGALSIDKENRTEGISWWREEQPNNKEMNLGLENLEKHNNKVDYVISHTLPQSLVLRIGNNTYEGHPWFDHTCVYLQHIYENVEFFRGYCGHWHDDKVVEKFTILYNTVKRIN